MNVYPKLTSILVAAVAAAGMFGQNPPVNRARPAPPPPQVHATRCPLSSAEVLELACSTQADSLKVTTVATVGLGFHADFGFISAIAGKCGKPSQRLVNTLLDAKMRTCGKPVFLRSLASPAVIDAGASTTLSWAASWATSVTITPGVGVLDPEGQQKVTPAQTTVYTMLAEGPGGSDTSLVTVTVTPPPQPVITAFQGTPAAIEHGKPSTLRWSVKDARTVRIEPGLGTVPLVGERVVYPEQSTTFTLTAEGPGGRVSSQFPVHVIEPPPDVTFTAAPLVVSRPQISTLRWNVRGASLITLDPDTQSLDALGTAVVRPYRTSTYTLRATGPGGTTVRDVTVMVLNPGPANGQFSWTGQVQTGMQNNIAINAGGADVGTIRGAPLPGIPCRIVPVDASLVNILVQPARENNYQRLVFQAKPKKSGKMTIAFQWVLE